MNKYMSLKDFLDHALRSYSYVFARTFIEDKTVLEVGCGNGYGTEFLSYYARWIKGIDSSASEIWNAKTKVKENISFEVGDAYSIPYEDKSIDVVVAFQIIEHLDRPKDFLEECCRVSDELILVTPNRRVREFPFQSKPFNLHHLREYDYKQLNKLLRNHYELVNIYGEITDHLTMEYKKAFRPSIPYVYLKLPFMKHQDEESPLPHNQIELSLKNIEYMPDIQSLEGGLSLFARCRNQK